MNLKSSYRQDSKLFKFSFILSLIILLIGIVNMCNNLDLDRYFDETFGSFASLLFMLIIECWALVFTLFGSFIYPGDTWYQIGLVVGFFINGFLIFGVLKLFIEIIGKKALKRRENKR